MSKNRELVEALSVALFNWRADPSPEAFARLSFAAGCVSGAVLVLERELEHLNEVLEPQHADHQGDASELVRANRAILANTLHRDEKPDDS